MGVGPLQQGGDPGQEDGGVVGLGDKPVAPQQEAAELVHIRAAAGDEEDGHVGEGPDLAAQGKAALPRQLDVQEDQMGLAVPDGGDHRREIRDGLGLVPVPLEKGDQLPLDGGVVLDDENAIDHGKTLLATDRF